MLDNTAVRKIIIGQLATLTGDKFQDFCDRYCLKLHPGDYQPVRAAGKAGDEKNDGYCPKARIFYAAFGSRGQTLAKIKRKIKSDLLGCLEKQVEVREWRFITNDDKLPGYIEKYIDKEFRTNKKFWKKYPKLEKVEAIGGVLITQVMIDKFTQPEIFEMLDLPLTEGGTIGQWSETNERTKKIEKIVEALEANAMATTKPTTVSTKPIIDAEEDEASQSKYKSELDAAKKLLDGEEFKACRKIYEKLLKEFNSDQTVAKLIRFKVHNNLGACLAGMGEGDEAAFHFKKAYELIGKTSVIACKNRAVASSLEGKPAEGLSFINAAIELSPDDNGAINIKAMLLRESGQIEEALKLYQE